MHKLFLRLRQDLRSMLACGGMLLIMPVLMATAASAAPTNSSPIALSRNDRLVFVVNPAQDTITVIDAVTRSEIGNVDIRDSLCNDPDRRRHFQPGGLAVSADNKALFVTRFLSFTDPHGGRQGRDNGKQGLVCRL